MRLWEYIESYRNEHNLSCDEFAGRCGLERRVIESIERGKCPTKPSLKVIMSLAEGMGISHTKLVEDVEFMDTDEYIKILDASAEPDAGEQVLE